jgi:cytoskeletal protein CcmA (bactofilin family)
MAIFSKEREAREPMPGATRGIAPGEGVMVERERSTGQLGGSAGVDAFLGKGTSITGKLVFDGTGRIEGRVEGEVSAQDTLTIGEGATVNAKVSGTSIIVEGHVTGDVTARQRLELRATGRVHGNVSAASLIVHEGAILDGQCTMKTAEAKPAHKPVATPVPGVERTPEAPVPLASGLLR